MEGCSGITCPIKVIGRHRQVRYAVLETLGPRLCTLVRRGVGLNTRVGAARFISSLAMRLASDMRRQSGNIITVRILPPPASYLLLLPRLACVYVHTRVHALL